MRTKEWHEDEVEINGYIPKALKIPVTMPKHD